MNGSVFEEKSSFNMQGLYLSSKLDWGYYISIAKTAFQEHWSFDLFYKASFSWGCSLYLQIFHTALHGILLSCLGCFFVAAIIVRKNTKTDIYDCWSFTCDLSLKTWLIIEIFSVGITLVDVYVNWLKWFHFFILEVDLLVTLIDCMIFMLPFLDVFRVSMSTVSFLAQPDSGIVCL